MMEATISFDVYSVTNHSLTQCDCLLYVPLKFLLFETLLGQIVQATGSPQGLEAKVEQDARHLM